MQQMLNFGNSRAGCHVPPSLSRLSEITSLTEPLFHFILSLSNVSLGGKYWPTAAISKMKRKRDFYDRYKNTMA